MGAGSGLAENRLFIEVHAYAAGGSVLHGASHAIRNFRDERGDVEMTLHVRLEIGNFIRRRGMLHVIERSAVGDGGNHGSQLQRGHGNAFAERAHFANAAQLRGNYFIRIGSGVLAGNVVAGEFT